MGKKKVLFSFQTKSQRNMTNPGISTLTKDCFSFLVGQPARLSKLEMASDQKKSTVMPIKHGLRIKVRSKLLNLRETGSQA